MLESKKIKITLVILAIILIGVGVFFWNKGVTPTIIEKVNQTIVQSPVANRIIFVDVAGEVVNPGVISLVLGARVGEAIASAGGMTVEADKIWVAQNLNKAKILTDGEKIFIPRIVESVNDQNIKININKATESELDKLAGVGSVTAQKIITNRPYAAIEDLLIKKVVSEKVFEQIKDMISTW